MQYFNEIPISQSSWITIVDDYHGNSLEKDIKVSLRLDAKHLVFTTSSSLFSKPVKTKGSCKEGLWEDEVSEFFLFTKGSTHYQEFNVSPKGFYWGMNFSSHRKRENEIIGIEYFSNELEFGIKILRTSLLAELESATGLIHISGVLPNTGKLYSSNPLKNKAPDFHDVESALPIIF